MHRASGSNHPGRSSAVARRAQATRWSVALALLVAAGCDTVEGGAVELSWKLRPGSSSLEDKFVDCDSERAGTGPVTEIRLHWEVENDNPDPTGKTGSASWLCRFNHGVTGFALPEGTANLWVTPECASGPAAPSTYLAPAIVQRTVIRGDTVSLGAIELVVTVAGCDTAPCICGAEPALDARPSASP